MTDLEKALGLDRARQEYAAEALAAASKAFFEGKGFGAIADAAMLRVKHQISRDLQDLKNLKLKKQKKFMIKEKRCTGRLEQGTTVEYLVKDIRFLRD